MKSFVAEKSTQSVSLAGGHESRDETHYFVVEEGAAVWGEPFNTFREAQAACNARNGLSKECSD